MKNVTVLIPNYNHVKYVGNAVESALKQGAGVIIYDDASTDGSREFLRDSMEDWKNRGDVQLILGHENSGTTSKPYNIMLSYTDTEFWVPLSADDMLAPGAITTLLEHMEGYDWVYSNLYLVDKSGLVFDVWNYDNFPREPDAMREFVRINVTSPAPFVGMLRTSFIKDNGLKFIDFDNVDNGEDLRTILEWINHNPRIGFIPAYLWFYRRHTGTRSYKSNPMERLEFKKEIDRILGVNDD